MAGRESVHRAELTLLLAPGEYFPDFRDVAETALTRDPAEAEPGRTGGPIDRRQEAQLLGVGRSGLRGAAGEGGGCVLHTFIMIRGCDTVVVAGVGDAIRHLQSVVDIACQLACTVDGIFAPRTDEQVGAVQGWNELTHDGWVGPTPGRRSTFTPVLTVSSAGGSLSAEFCRGYAPSP